MLSICLMECESVVLITGTRGEWSCRGLATYFMCFDELMMRVTFFIKGQIGYFFFFFEGGGYKFCFILLIALNLLDYCLKIIYHAFSNTIESCWTLKGYNIKFCSEKVLKIGGFIFILSPRFCFYVWWRSVWMTFCFFF